MFFKYILFCALLWGGAQAQSARQNKLDDLTDSLLANLPGEVAGAKIAVVPFNDETGENNFSLAIAEYLIVSLQKKSQLSLVDRTAFQKVLEEIELSQSDLVQDSNAVEIGKMVAAQYILTGSVIKIFGKYKVVAKIIQVETGAIASSEAVTMAMGRLDELSKEILSERAQASSVIFRSAVMPGWGQLYAHRPIRGAFWFVAAAGAAGYLTYSIIDWNSKVTEFDKVDNSSPIPGETLEEFNGRKKSAETTANDAADRTTLAAIILGSVWAVNIVDATLVGLSEKKRFKQLYFSAAPAPHMDGGSVNLTLRF